VIASAELHSLCIVCAKLCFRPGAFVKDDRRPTKFFKSLQLLEKSARSGCHLCMLIFTSLAPQNGADDSWKIEPDGTVKCGYRENGEPHLLVQWNLLTRRFKLSSLPSPRVLRQQSIPAVLQASPILPHCASESKKRTCLK